MAFRVAGAEGEIVYICGYRMMTCGDPEGRPSYCTRVTGFPRTPDACERGAHWMFPAHLVEPGLGEEVVG